jgi:hypothetical protein
MTVAHLFRLVAGLLIALSSIFMLLSLVPNQSAYGGTFPGENGKIAFARTVENSWEIYVMNADGTGQTMLTNNPGLDGNPDWSPDGTKIAFANLQDGIYVMNTDGSGQTILTDNGGYPSWSPDGTKIAFYREAEIYVVNADGTGQTRLTNNADFDVSPSWSPDGTKIAFSRTDSDGNDEIYVMNADDGSDQTNLSNNSADDFDPSWSPDGTKIAFTSDRDNGNDEIYVMNADGTGQTRLTRRAASDWDPYWSPDGTKIAFTIYTNEPGSHNIFVMNADGTSLTRLTSNPTADFHPSWSPNISSPPEEDITSPVLSVPEDITEEATGPDGAEVKYTVTAEDNIDGNATLEEDGTTVTQDDVRGNITISCDPPSGSVFPIGDTEVECSAIDEAGNTGDASFTVTVNPPPTPAEAIDKLISDVQNLDDGVPQSVKTSLTAPLKEASHILNDDNPNNDKAVCGKLGAFINQVNANERRDTLTANQADDLRTQAEDIRDALDC